MERARYALGEANLVSVGLLLVRQGMNNKEFETY